MVPCCRSVYRTVLLRCLIFFLFFLFFRLIDFFVLFWFVLVFVFSRFSYPLDHWCDTPTYLTPLHALNLSLHSQYFTHKTSYNFWQPSGRHQTRIISVHQHTSVPTYQLKSELDMDVDILSYTVEQVQSIIVTLLLVSIAAKRTKIAGPGPVPMHGVHTPYSSPYCRHLQC